MSAIAGFSPHTETSIDKNAICETARKEFLDWFDNNRLGEGNYKEAAEKVKKIALEHGFNREEITLHHHIFRFGFHLYYGERNGQEKFLQVPRADGMVLAWQANDPEGSYWPIQDSSTKDYFFPKVTENRIDPPSGSCPTNQYLDQIARCAQCDKSSKEYRILEALLPYKDLIFSASPLTYHKISQIVPEYEKRVPKEKCNFKINS